MKTIKKFEKKKRAVSGLRTERSGIRVPVMARELSLVWEVQNGSGALAASYSMFTGLLSRSHNCPGRDIDHTPPSSAKNKNEWSHTSTRPIRPHDVKWSKVLFFNFMYRLYSIYTDIRSRVQKFPAWHTKAAPNVKCCEGYIVPSMVRLMYQLKSVLK